MAIIKPFAALRPTREKAEQVSAPNYDRTSRGLSLEEMQINPFSYLHVVKPYLHFKGEKKNPAKHFPLGLEYLKKFKDEKILIKDESAVFYIYQIIKGSVAYTSIFALASIDDYLNDIILKHENTLVEKENELANHISFFNGLGNPVLLTYPDNKKIDEVINRNISEHIPEYNFISADQIKHNLWLIKNESDIKSIEDEFSKIKKLYIADGHHRTAGFATYCKRKREELIGYSGNELFNSFPVCLIPFEGIQLFEYHRLIRDKTSVNNQNLISKINELFDIIPSGNLPVQPLAKGEFGIYFNHTAFLLKLKKEFANSLIGTLEKLDVSIVEEYLLKRVFNINDSRTDKRLSFIDGSKGILTLEKMVDDGPFDLAITLFPTSIEEMKKVADEKLIMPPKSTWIEPKIRTGLLIFETI